MPKLSGHWPAWPSAPRPCPGAQRLASVVQSPSVVWRHHDSTAACARTVSSSMPHLQAAHCKISSVVPLKLPVTRAAIWVLARGSPLRKLLDSCWLPRVALKVAFTRLFSGRRLTAAAHAASLGSADPGGRVAKCWPDTGVAVDGTGVAGS